MNNNTPIILINSLNVVRGGLTKAVFIRANTLAEKFDTVYIFTFLYQQNYYQIIDELYEKGLLNRKVKILNLFEDLKTNKKVNKKVINSIEEEGLISFKDTKQENPSYRFYKDGLYVKYKRFDQQGNLLFIDYMDESRHRIKREEYNLKGLLARIRHMDNSLNKPRLDRYFDDRGNCYLTIWVNPQNNTESRAVTFGSNPREYNSTFELSSNWVESKMIEISNPVLMVDNRHMDKLVLSLEGKKDIKKIAVIHNNHFKKPFNINSEVKNDYLDLFSNVDKFNKIVYLTEEQKRDVENQYGINKNFVVIPHSAKQVKQKVEKKLPYNSNLAVSLARYVDQKRLDEAINAFKFVVEEIPNAEYHIYGFGKGKDELNRLIKKLGLENNVKLKGFTSDAASIYKSASCSILTSDFEGFGMVLTESLAAGTPVVSYDAKYGPSDIIRNGVDGYLVEKGNQEALAENIVKIMQNRDLREELSKNSYDVLERFNDEDYKNDWINLVGNL